MELIRTGAADVALVRLPLDRTGLHTIPLYTETTVAGAPTDHLVTATEEATVADLADEIILRPQDDTLVCPVSGRAGSGVQWRRSTGSTAPAAPTARSSSPVVRQPGTGGDDCHGPMVSTDTMPACTDRHTPTPEPTSNCTRREDRNTYIYVATSAGDSGATSSNFRAKEESAVIGAASARALPPNGDPAQAPRSSDAGASTSSLRRCRIRASPRE